jgi:small-conductance mechanosensitive channel
VQLGGIKGDVIDISLLRTTLMEIGEWVRGDAYSGRIVRIANSFVFKEPVFNYSGDFPFLWDEMVIPVKYGSNYRLARQIIQDSANVVVGDYSRSAKETWETMVKKYMVEEASVEPLVSMSANDNWVEFNLRYVVDFKRRRGTKDAITMRILEEIEASQGQVAIASATFALVEAPALEIRLSGDKN